MRMADISVRFPGKTGHAGVCFCLSGRGLEGSGPVWKSIQRSISDGPFGFSFYVGVCYYWRLCA